MGRKAILRVHVVPNAMSDCIVGEHGGAVKIKLRAPAVEGKANAALISFLAEQLNISRGAIALERGHKSRDKLIRVNGLKKTCATDCAREIECLKGGQYARLSFHLRLPLYLTGSELFVTAWLAGAARSDHLPRCRDKTTRRGLVDW
jgi:uncharacterized protein